MVDLATYFKDRGPRPSFIDLSMCAPIDVKANRQLYCRICFKKRLQAASPSNLANDFSGSGRSLKGGMSTLPDLQHLL